jgi:tRNA pseudouridine55 synthase
VARGDRKSVRGRNVCGILLLDKRAGASSNGVLQELKRLYRARKAGHTGSLDPIATGLLPICFGDATKLSSYFLDADKRYFATLRLGVSTTTADSEGEPLETRPVVVSADDLEKSLVAFRGEIEQIPPMYSALKKDGKPLYKLAREGKVVDRLPRAMNVYKLTGEMLEQDSATLSISCSSGFYVRQLAHDLGERLGCGAHLTGLRRLGVGGLNIANSYTVDQLAMLGSDEERDACMLAPDQAIGHVPAVSVIPNAAFYFCRGEQVRTQERVAPGRVRVYDENGQFLGIGEVMPDFNVAPRRLFASITA